MSEFPKHHRRCRYCQSTLLDDGLCHRVGCDPTLAHPGLRRSAAARRARAQREERVMFPTTEELRHLSETSWREQMHAMAVNAEKRRARA